MPELFIVATGIRVEGDADHDQRRVATPGDAFAAGADLLVLGRTDHRGRRSRRPPAAGLWSTPPSP